MTTPTTYQGARRRRGPEPARVGAPAPPGSYAMTLHSGSCVMVAYDVSGPLLGRERLILAACRTPAWHSLLSPSLDTLVEQIDDGRRAAVRHDACASEVVGLPGEPSAEDRARGAVPQEGRLVLTLNLAPPDGLDIGDLVKGSRVALPSGAMGVGGAALGPRPAEAPGTDIVFYRARPAGMPPVGARDAEMDGVDARMIPMRFKRRARDGGRSHRGRCGDGGAGLAGRVPLQGPRACLGRREPGDVPPPRAPREPRPGLGPRGVRRRGALHGAAGLRDVRSGELSQLGRLRDEVSKSSSASGSLQDLPNPSGLLSQRLLHGAGQTSGSRGGAELSHHVCE